MSGDKYNHKDQVNHPKHYNKGKIEVIEFIEDQQLNFHKGNAVKYICRAGAKDPNKYVQDLEKAIWYLRREMFAHLHRTTGQKIPRPNEMPMDRTETDDFKVMEGAIPNEVAQESNH